MVTLARPSEAAVAHFRMWAVHGTANSLGFALAGLLAWSLASRYGRRTTRNG